MNSTGQNFTESDRILGNVFNRWIFGVYYVSQVLLVVSNDPESFQEKIFNPHVYNFYKTVNPFFISRLGLVT